MNKPPNNKPDSSLADDSSSATQANVPEIKAPQAASASQPNLPDGRDASSVPKANQEPDPAALVQLNADTSSINADSAPEQLVGWGLSQFSDRKIVVTTSFGMEGCALIDMCSKAIEADKLPPITVAYIDTGFFFPETHQLREQLIDRYQNLHFAKWETDVSIKQQAESYGDQLWKNNPNLCCHIRKVVPMQENVVGFDVWMTGVRRSQTESRAQTEVLSWDWRYQVLKFCPLAAWERADVWKYVQKNDVPFNRLHLQNYPSVSCFHCTKPVPGSTPDSDARDGRWEGDDKDECGLHFSI